MLLSFTLYLREIFQVQAPRGGGGGLYLEGRFNGWFFASPVSGGLIFGGAYTWRGLFSEFYGSRLFTSLTDTSRLSRGPYIYILLFQILTSMSESSLHRDILLPSLVLLYPYFELGIKQDEIRKALLIKQETE